MSKRVIFSMEIDSENAAFQDDPALELADMLSMVEEKIRQGAEGTSKLFDANGNPCGTVTVNYDEAFEGNW